MKYLEEADVRSPSRCRRVKSRLISGARFQEEVV